jgi:hypothetical protein
MKSSTKITKMLSNKLRISRFAREPSYGLPIPTTPASLISFTLTPKSGRVSAQPSCLTCTNTISAQHWRVSWLQAQRMLLMWKENRLWRKDLQIWFREVLMKTIRGKLWNRKVWNKMVKISKMMIQCRLIKVIQLLSVWGTKLTASLSLL